MVLGLHQYSNGSYITSTATVSNPIKILITKSPTMILSEDFVPNYSQAIGFSLNNNSKYSLNLISFEFNINGSFLDYIADSTQFILKRKGTNTIFGTMTKAFIVNNLLTIPFTGNDFDEI